MSVTHIGAARFERASKAEECSPADTLRAALRDIEAGTWSPVTIAIVGVLEDGEDTVVETYHGGRGNSMERIGMLTRAQWAMQG